MSEDDELYAMDRRQGMRAMVIRSAKLVCGPGQGIYDCLVLEQSDSGVQVDLGAVVELPEVLTIQLAGGAAYLARRVWASGTRAGLQLEGAQLLSEQTAKRMKKFSELMDSQGLLTAVATLRAARFLEHGELQRLAETAERAYLALERFLHNPVT